MAPKYIQVLTFRTLLPPFWQKGSYDAKIILGHLCGPNVTTNVLIKGRQGEREESNVMTETRCHTGGFEDEGRATSQEMLVAPRGRKRQGNDSPVELPGGICPADILALAQ